MPLYRAYFDSASEARDAAGVAAVALAAAWTAAAGATGVTIAESAPVVTVSIESVAAGPPTPGLPDYWRTALRIGGPDGRSEIAESWMPRAQAAALASYASGTAYAFHTEHSKIRVRGRVAKSIQVQTSAAAVLTTAHKLQDPATNKKYSCAAASPAAAGTWTVLVTEDDASDLSDVTHGTVLEFLAPPVTVNPLARVNSVKGYTISPGEVLSAESGKRYVVVGAVVEADGSGLSGDLTTDVTILRDLSDGLDFTSAELGAEFTWVTTPTNVGPTAIVVEKHDKVIPAGAVLRDAASTRFYELTAETAINDSLLAIVPIKAQASGSGHNLVMSETLTLVTPPTGVTAAATVITSTLAAPYPQAFPSQVVGGAMEWVTNIFQAANRRWCAEVFTLPYGS